jgi:LacI family transcriptional regulator
MEESGIGVDPSWLTTVNAVGGYDDTNAADLGRLITSELLKNDPRITGLVALNDMHGLGACAAIRERGGDIPHDISVVTIDDVLASLVHPALTAVHHPIETLCVSAVERVIGCLEGQSDDRSHHVAIPPEIVVRRSTGAPRQSGRVLTS